MLILIKSVILASIIFLVSINSFAQNRNQVFEPYENSLEKNKDDYPDEDNGDDNDEDKQPPSSTPVPFDGGLSLIIAAGAGIGIKTARDKRKKAQITSKLNEK